MLIMKQRTLAFGMFSFLATDLLRPLVLLQDACLDELVDELLHGVEGGEETLWKHDEARVG